MTFINGSGIELEFQVAEAVLRFVYKLVRVGH